MDDRQHCVQKYNIPSVAAHGGVYNRSAISMALCSPDGLCVQAIASPETQTMCSLQIRPILRTNVGTPRSVAALPNSAVYISRLRCDIGPLCCCCVVRQGSVDGASS